MLFVDLVGSTALAEDRDPEDVRATLSEYFDAASETVQRHGGVVEKFIGDAVMAVWGTPVAHEDDAERAVRAGLDIVDRVAALGQHLGLPLQARAGVLTGEAVASVDAVDQRLVAGDLVNTAARIQSAAEPGTVLVGERTYRATAGAITFTALEPLSVKGKAEPVPAWRADRVVGELRGSGRGTGPEPPFAGRSEELRLAKDLLRATSREGKPRLLSVSGVAGIGKSRLVWELRKYVDGLTESIYWHQGRCPAYGDAVAFWALADMVRSRVGIAETDDEAVSRERLDAHLAESVSDGEERAWLRPRLGHLLGLDPAPPGGHEELFGAWRRFFEIVAAKGTTVLVVEDLQWADPGLMDFLESLLTWSRTSPILVITLARPELAEHRPTWGATVRASTRLHLEPLTPDEITAMVTGYVEGIDPTDLTRIVQRAEGIPLYAAETVRMLADRGLLEPTGTHYRVTAPLGETLQVPETLHALVAARLDALPDHQRALVLDAAVLGHSFTVDALTAVTTLAVEAVTPALDALVGKEVLGHDMDPRSTERGQFHFIQSVIQEVAYATLSKPVRRARHLAYAEWLAGLADAELAGIIASHYLAAYRAEPSADGAEDVADQARAWLHQAADRAISLGSPTAAARHAEQALPLARTIEERAGLHETAAVGTLMADGDRDRAWKHFTTACDNYEELGKYEAEAELLATYGVPFGETRYDAEVGQRLGDVRDRLLEPVPAKVQVLAALAHRATQKGSVDDGLRLSEEALVMAQLLGDDESLLIAATSRGSALFKANRHFEAAMHSEAALTLARTGGSTLRQTVAWGQHAMVLTTVDPRAALNAFLTSAALAARIGVRVLQCNQLANAAEAAIDLGELDQAKRALVEAEEIGANTPWVNDGLTLSQALLAAYQGEVDDAAAMLDRLETSRRDQWSGSAMTTWFLRTRAAVRLLDGDPSGALADCVEGIELDASDGNAPTELWQGVLAAASSGQTDAIESLLQSTSGLRGRWVDSVRNSARAALVAMAGSPEQAAEQMSRALDRWREQELPLDHALAASLAAGVLPPDLAPDEDISAARSYLEGIGATGLLRLMPG